MDRRALYFLFFSKMSKVEPKFGYSCFSLRNSKFKKSWTEFVCFFFRKSCFKSEFNSFFSSLCGNPVLNQNSVHFFHFVRKSCFKAEFNSFFFILCGNPVLKQNSACFFICGVRSNAEADRRVTSLQIAS